jgi:serine protease Do
MKSISPARLLLFLCLALFVPPSSRANTLKITSTPGGASVEIDGIKVGITACEMKLPSSYFHKPHTVFGDRLEHPMKLRISKDGYVAKAIVLTDGPVPWIAVTGAARGAYWLLKSDHFDIVLDRVSTRLTGATVATSDARTRIEMRPELPTEQIVETAKPAVVLLRGSDKQGSGFFITSTGVIATNAHVAGGEDSLRAVMPAGEELIAKVIYIDPELDIALAKADGEGFTFLPLADLAAVRQGQAVIALGNPGGGMPFSITKGIVSAIGPVEAELGTWIQTDRRSIRATAEARCLTVSTES